MLSLRRRRARGRIGLWACFGAGLALVWAAGPLWGQIQMGAGRGRQASGLVGSGGRNPAVQGYSSLGNQIVSGNVGGGKSFKGGGIGDPRSFQGGLGSSSLSNFRRDSYGLQGNSAALGAPQPFYLPSSTVLGVRGITSGRGRPGSSMPSNVRLAPLRGSGPGQAAGGGIPRIASPAAVDQRVDLRPFGPRPVVETGSNLFGRQVLPLGQAGRFGPNVAAGAETALSKRRLGRPGTQDDLGQPFQALPEWARPKVDVTSEEGAEGRLSLPGPLVEPSAAERDLKQNVEEPKNLLEESSGGMGLPNVMDIYEQMQAERQSREQAEAISTGKTGLITPMESTPQEDPKAAGKRLAAKLLSYNTFVSRRAGNFNDYMAQGESLLKRGEYYSAENAYRQAIKLEPANPLGYLGRAYSLAGAGSLVSAAKSLGQALAIFPGQAEAKIDLVEFYNSSEELARIIKKLDKLVELKEKDVQVRLLLGYFYHYSGDSELAKAVLAEAAELAKTDKKISPEFARTIEKFAQDVSKQEGQVGGGR